MVAGWFRNRSLQKKLERGEIEEERINEAVRKILKYKFERVEDFAVGSEEEFGSEAHKAIVQRVGEGD